MYVQKIYGRPGLLCTIITNTLVKQKARWRRIFIWKQNRFTKESLNDRDITLTISNEQKIKQSVFQKCLNVITTTSTNWSRDGAAEWCNDERWCRDLASESRRASWMKSGLRDDGEAELCNGGELLRRPFLPAAECSKAAPGIDRGWPKNVPSRPSQHVTLM